MVTLADSLVSSTSRAVQLRMRPDLTVKRQQYQGTSYWVVKEPIGLNYYRFHDEEYAILNMMDGQTSMETMKEEFERQFAPQKVSFSDLQAKAEPDFRDTNLLFFFSWNWTRLEQGSGSTKLEAES